MNTVINTLNNLSRSEDELLVELWEVTLADSFFSAAHGEFDTIRPMNNSNRHLTGLCPVFLLG